MNAKIYTRTGDTGETATCRTRLKKNTVAICLLGEIDELNSILGIVLSELGHEVLIEELLIVQQHLFAIGAEVAEHPDHEIDLSTIERLEIWIDRWQEELPALKSFILPGGGRAGAYFHLARAVCRRAERTAVDLLEKNVCYRLILIQYLNRLSDYLFVVARYVNQMEEKKEQVWKKPKV